MNDALHTAAAQLREIAEQIKANPVRVLNLELEDVQVHLATLRGRIESLALAGEPVNMREIAPHVVGQDRVYLYLVRDKAIMQRCIAKIAAMTDPLENTVSELDCDNNLSLAIELANDALMLPFTATDVRPKAS